MQRTVPAPQRVERHIFGMTEQQWHRMSIWPLGFAGLAFLASFSLGVFIPEYSTLLFTRMVEAVVWAIFAADYVISLYLAHNRIRWFFRHLLLLFIVILPALHPLRLLWSVTVFTAIHRVTSAVLRERVLIMVIAASGLLVYLASLAVWELERNNPMSEVVTYGDAVWWAVMTITTVGYGDIVPITSPARTIGVVLMLAGVASAGCITAILASWLIDVAGERQGRRTATAEHIDLLASEIRMLRAEVAAMHREHDAQGGRGHAPVERRLEPDAERES